MGMPIKYPQILKLKISYRSISHGNINKNQSVMYLSRRSITRSIHCYMNISYYEKEWTPLDINRISGVMVLTSSVIDH
jgi:hypothetical protein